MTKPPPDAQEGRTERSSSCRAWKWVISSELLRLVEILTLVVGAIFLWLQIDVAREAEKRGLRAYVAVKPADISVEQNKVAAIPITIVNSGQTPAYRLRFSARAFDELADKALEWNWNFSEKDTLDQRIGALSGSTTRSIRMDSTINLNVGGREGRQFYVVGIIYYDDVYNRSHWTSFCLVWPSKSTNSGTFCDRFNETDETLPKLPKKGPLTIPSTS